KGGQGGASARAVAPFFIEGGAGNFPAGGNPGGGQPPGSYREYRYAARSSSALAPGLPRPDQLAVHAAEVRADATEECEDHRRDKEHQSAKHGQERQADRHIAHVCPIVSRSMRLGQSCAIQRCCSRASSSPSNFRSSTASVPTGPLPSLRIINETMPPALSIACCWVIPAPHFHLRRLAARVGFGGAPRKRIPIVHGGTQHRQGQLGAILASGAIEDVVHVLLDRPGRQVQPRADFFVLETFGNQRAHPPLLGR